MADDRRDGSLAGSLLRRGLRRARSATDRVLGREGQGTGTARVRFELPDGHSIDAEVAAGTRLLHAAMAEGIDLSHYCGGTCSCGTCRVEIRGDARGLSPMEGREQMVLGFEAMQRGDRLACQARVLGAVSVSIPKDF